MTPDTLPYAAIELVARNPARGVYRRWRLQAARDLFGRVTVQTAWGRIGAPGRTLTRSFVAEDEALRYVRALLRRRAGAPRRLGTGYVAG
jgi:predicted DNA-binding WGR domain protein